MMPALVRTVSCAALLLSSSAWITGCGGSGGSAESGAPVVQPSSLALFAGAIGGYGYFDGVGEAAKFRSPRALAVDALDNVYVADSGNGVIRKISASGTTSTVAGMAGESGFIDGAGSQARFGNGIGGNSGLQDVAIDIAGNLYVADTLNHSIRKVSPDGVVSTLAGDGTRGSADGRGSAARFFLPAGIAVDGSMTVYVADTGNQTLRRIAPDGTVSTLAGAPGEVGYVDGPSAQARFNQPYRLAVDHAGNLYIVSNAAIRRRAADGTVSTLVQPPPSTAGGDAVGDAAYVRADGIAVDSSGNVYASDLLNGSVRKISPDGQVATFAGRKGFECPRNGPADSARFWSPTGIAVAASGTVYVTETNPSTIRAILPSREVVTLAGAEPGCTPVDGPVSTAQLNAVSDLVADAAGTLYVVDRSGRVVRRISSGVVSTLPSLYRPMAKMALAPSGTIYVMGYEYPLICRIGCVWKPFATLVQIAAGSVSELRSSADASGELGAAGGLAYDSAGALLWSDAHYHVVRKLDTSGELTVLAGSPGVSGSDDGVGAAARFNAPAGIVIGPAGRIYVADAGNHVVRSVDPDGRVITIAGAPGEAGNIDGPAASARFNRPAALALDHDGDLYVADGANCVVRKIAVSGLVSTVAGTAGQCGFREGALPGALDGVSSLAIVGPDLYIGMDRGIAVVRNKP